MSTSKSSDSIRKGYKSSISLRKSQKSVVLSPDNVIKLGPNHLRIMEKLYDPIVTPALFGSINVEEMRTKSLVTFGVQDSDGKVVGVMTLNPYPNIPALPPWEWDHWISNIYGLTETHSRNTTFIHLLLWDPAYYFLFLRPLLQHMFNVRNHLKFCILVVPPGRHRIDFVGNMGNAVMSKDYAKHKTANIYMYSTGKTSWLQECYGSYYIAELLTRHKDMGRHIIVAEYQGTAVSVLCLNEIVNFKVLNEEFELAPYNGLKKPHPDDLIDLSMEDIRQSLDKLHTKAEDEYVFFFNFWAL
ncbi:hypothetical protein JTB14_021706 [Gonioctena quinquepunctata]|nr:hypothetical protein JTB14_021706 [Gonioctena quinquepunctata]